MDRLRGQNVMSTIDNTPGVSTLTTGAGSAKPVIRGLTGQRVLVATDGVRQEEQQFGDDHTVDVDSFNVDKVEVIRGPASVLYGSDALGGVINVIRSKAPMPQPDTPKLAGAVTLNTFSNNKQDAGNLALFGASGLVGYRGSYDKRKASQITTPNGKLPNTGMTETNKNASLSTQGSWGHIYLDAFSRQFEQDLYNNPNQEDTPNGGQTYQRISHDKAHLHTFLIFHYFDLEMDLGYQRNNRREIEDKFKLRPIQSTLLEPIVGDFDKAYGVYQVSREPTKQGLNLFLDTSTIDTKLHHKQTGNLKGTIGVSCMNQKNRTIASEPLIPNYNLINVAAYLFEEYKLGDLTFSAGARTDRRNVDIFDNATLGVVPQTRNFSANTGTVGSVYRFAKQWAVAANFGRGFRAPTVFELFSNGVHEGSGRFETGANTLKPEYSNNRELSLRYATSKIQGELTYYKNIITNYIYPDRLGTFDPDSGLPRYQYRQGNAQLTGGEFAVQAEVLTWLVINGGVDIVRGVNMQTGEALPRMTANRGKSGFKFVLNSFFPKYNPYIITNAKFVAPQYRVGPQESTTAGYNLYDAGFGFELPGLGTGPDGERSTFDFMGTNLTNKAYVDHLSRYKDYALSPGINMTFKINVPFTLIN